MGNDPTGRGIWGHLIEGNGCFAFSGRISCGLRRPCHTGLLGHDFAGDELAVFPDVGLLADRGGFAFYTLGGEVVLG